MLQDERDGQIERFVNDGLKHALQEAQREAQMVASSQIEGVRQKMEEIEAKVDGSLENISGHVQQLVEDNSQRLGLNRAPARRQRNLYSSKWRLRTKRQHQKNDDVALETKVADLVRKDVDQHFSDLQTNEPRGSDDTTQLQQDVQNQIQDSRNCIVQSIQAAVGINCKTMRDEVREVVLEGGARLIFF
ncbi:hypothetical protein GQ600_12986 [Phytophthora cactorum]|nr:hypothetical protein GQ600_12986 [Phytophthora cactorum]